MTTQQSRYVRLLDQYFGENEDFDPASFRITFLQLDDDTQAQIRDAIRVLATADMKKENPAQAISILNLVKRATFAGDEFVEFLLPVEQSRRELVKRRERDQLRQKLGTVRHFIRRTGTIIFNPDTLAACAIGGILLGIVWVIFTLSTIPAPADFSLQVIEDCQITEVRTRDATFEHATIKKCDFSGKDIRGASYFMATIGPSPDVQFNRANARYANFGLAKMSGGSFKNADLTRTNLAGADLSNSDLSGANLSDVDLSNANLANSDLRGTNLDHATLVGTGLKGANLRGARLGSTIIDHANLDQADLTGANFARIDSDYRKTAITNSSFIGADFSGANFSFVIFSNDNFQNAKLSGVKTRGASFREKSNYSGASILLYGEYPETMK